MDCAWTLDGAMDNCVYALSLASRIESIRLVHEPIRFHSDFKFNVQNALKIDSSSSESILMRIILNREPRSRGACGANDSAYGNSGPSGVVSAVGSLFPRGTKANVVAYGSGRGPPANEEIINDRGWLIGPPGKYERWLSGASTGSVGIGYYNRPGELTVACRNRHASYAFD
ncbi:hypothetical protein PIB30_020417 [Stylosanthes scabra]|uniref:Uncharacterized protein n=1 Tax=Stylosanthes scabra TaxID=79078 RepID=A0ABU6S984_9FABA|nr:hypothetical protein [Stylosanthes scabra]